MKSNLFIIAVFFASIVYSQNWEVNTVWSKHYGGSSWDIGSAAIKDDLNSGYLFIGNTNSANHDVSPLPSVYDFYWVAKTDESGDIQWAKSYSGYDSQDYLTSAVQLSDGGFMLAGYTNSTTGYVHGNHGSTDVWIIRTNQQGDTLWTKCFGGSSTDYCSFIIPKLEARITSYLN